MSLLNLLTEHTWVVTCRRMHDAQRASLIQSITLLWMKFGYYFFVIFSLFSLLTKSELIFTCTLCIITHLLGDQAPTSLPYSSELNLLSCITVLMLFLQWLIRQFCHIYATLRGYNLLSTSSVIFQQPPVLVTIAVMTHHDQKLSINLFYTSTL